MAGIEDILNLHGEYRFREWFEHLNAKILKPLLMRDTKKCDYDASEILRLGFLGLSQFRLKYMGNFKVVPKWLSGILKDIINLF